MSAPMPDMSGRIAALPQKRRDASILPPRRDEQYISLHYSGVVYADRSHNAEMQRIVDEAAYQMTHNYGSAGDPAYPDGLLYDFVVLSDGTSVRTRANRVQLWHCGNALGNSASWAVHVMLGPGQDVTDAQQRAVFDLLDAVRAQSGIPRDAVVSHCEWPRGNGAPVISPAYRLQPGQSACPGARLHARLTAAYRAMRDAPRAVWTVTLRQATDVYQDRRLDAPVAARFEAGAIVEVDDLTNDFYHAASGIGFFAASQATYGIPYIVGSGGATLRAGPTRASGIVRQAKPGETLLVVQENVIGQLVAGTDRWHRIDGGAYVHSGAVQKL